LSVVNLGEVVYIVERERGLPKAQETLARIDELPIDVVSVDRTLTLAAAHLKMDCPIAYADCFAAALSQIKNATLVTGNPEFGKLKPDCNVQIEWLGKE
jgi:ribonuclease VapC